MLMNQKCTTPECMHVNVAPDKQVVLWKLVIAISVCLNGYILIYSAEYI